MKNKIAAFLCMTVLSISLLAGCGDSNKETTAQTTASEAATSAETEAAKTEAGETEGAETEAKAAKAEGEVISDTTAAGWHIVVEDVEINKSLENVSVDLGYTGVETSAFVKEAGEGNSFCLVKLKIEKEDSKEVIDWPNLKMKDAEGNEYARVEDEFLTDLGMHRMSGTALNFGSNEGWIAFEIKEGATGLQLSYPFEAEEYICDLSSVQ